MKISTRSNNTSNSADTVKDILIDQNCHLTTENGLTIRVAPYADGLVRIQLSKDELSYHSYAVIGQPEERLYHWDQRDDSITLNTGSLRVEIQLSPFRVAFYTENGQLINEDEPAFGTNWIGTEVTTYKTIQEGERFIGLGEKTGGLDRRGNAYVNWNTDYFAYPEDGDPLYLSTPFYIGVHSGLCYGIFLDNSHKTTFNFGASNHRFSSFSADAGEMNYYFIYGENVADIIQKYSWLTGTMPMPPKWSLGLQQCRYSYYPDSELLEVAERFRSKNIPADVIYLDIHYMQDYKVFTWHSERFPNPKQLIDRLKELGFKVVLIIDPGIKVEEGYKPYLDGLEKDVFVKYPDGKEWKADVWPGTCHFPDFTKPETRQWWGEQFAENVKLGIEGYWNDMNEPAAWGQSPPSLIEFDFDGNLTTHREARNVYGMNMARSTNEGARKLLNGKRPFTLTRAGFSGIQRYAAVWTGDNVASDGHMLAGMRLLVSMGLTGMPFTGFDVGGFQGEPSPALFARWIALGAFTPMFRCHSMINTRDAEPWAFGEEVEDISRNYISLRYKLLPYLYSAFYEASETAMPVVRSLAIEHTHDANIYNGAYQDEFLFGPSILVAPVDSIKQITKVYLPKGNWFEFYTDKPYSGGVEHYIDCPQEKLPLFVKAGAIIPMQSTVQHTGELPETTLSLHIYKGSGTYTYYEDDGATYEHKSGSYYKREIELDNGSLLLGTKSGEYSTHFKEVKVYFHGYSNIAGVKADGEDIQVHEEQVRFVQPITKFDPVVDQADDVLKIEDVPTVNFNLSNDKTLVTWD